MTIAKAVESTHEKSTARKLETATDPIQNRRPSRPSRPSKPILLILKKIILQKVGRKAILKPSQPSQALAKPSQPARCGPTIRQKAA